jgi:23S rRNA pseudouridine2605 synthase
MEPERKKPGESPQAERLHKRIAASGIASRRKAEELIREGRVEVNGEVVREMGIKVGPDDVVTLDGEPLGVAKSYTLVMNKPVGYVTTLSDPQGRPTVKRLLPDVGVMLKPVGRLDMDSEGLLIFTNDGDLAQRLTHPKFGIEKEYLVTVEGSPDERALDKLRKGVWISEGGKTNPAKVQVVHADKAGKTASLRITIHEGRKRQIRLMCEAVGHPVKTLRRVRIGPLLLRHMAPGECRMLGKKEIDALLSATPSRPNAKGAVKKAAQVAGDLRPPSPRSGKHTPKRKPNSRPATEKPKPRRG